MGDRINNMGKMMSNPKQRNMYLLGAGAVILTLGLGFFIANKNNSQELQSSANVEAVPGNIKAVPGSSNNPDYVQSVKNTNDKEALLAIQSGGSYIPTITSPNVNNAASLDEIARRQQQEAEEKSKKEVERKRIEEEERLRMENEGATQQALIDSQKFVAPNQPNNVQASAQYTQPAAPVVKKKYSEDDILLITALTSNWKVKAPDSEFNFAKQKPNNNSAGSAGSENAGSGSGNSFSNKNTGSSNPPLAKAGTIFHAIIETAVNSDEESPVLAKIVSGPLKGTRLIGSFKNLGEKVLIEFNLANIPALDKSTPFKAFAIDTKTSRTALADSVDNHYFKRYGVLLATSFISGYSAALTKSGTSTTQGIFGSTESTPKYDSKELNKIALGKVSDEVSKDIEKQSKGLVPTIYVNSGTAVGILLTDDLIIQ